MELLPMGRFAGTRSVLLAGSPPEAYGDTCIRFNSSQPYGRAVYPACLVRAYQAPIGPKAVAGSWYACCISPCTTLLVESCTARPSETNSLKSHPQSDTRGTTSCRVRDDFNETEDFSSTAFPGGRLRPVMQPSLLM